MYLQCSKAASLHLQTVRIGIDTVVNLIKLSTYRCFLCQSAVIHGLVARGRIVSGSYAEGIAVRPRLHVVVGDPNVTLYRVHIIVVKTLVAFQLEHIGCK